MFVACLYFLLSVFIAGLVLVLLWVIPCMCLDCFDSIAAKISGVTLAVVVFALSFSGMICGEIHEQKVWIEEYKTQKIVLEEALRGEYFEDGVFYTDVLRDVNALNKQLVQKQYNNTKWYDLFTPDEVMELELIGWDIEY